MRFFAIVAFLSLLIAVAYSMTCAADFGGCTATSYQGDCYATDNSNSYCACRSGYSDTNCTTAIDPTCSSSFNALNATQTGFAPTAVRVNFNANTLNIEIESPLVTERNYTIIAIDNSSFAKESCTYPGLYWSRSFNTTDPCRDVFVGAVPWSTNVGCGWVLDPSNVSFAIYTAELVVEHHDFSLPFGSRPGTSPVERIVQHVIPLSLLFPKNITVTSAITVQSPVRLLTAISRQNVSADGSAATIEITTNLLWPYKLANFAITSQTLGGTGATYTPQIVSSLENCVNDGVSSCTQVMRINIVTGDKCNLNGQFNLVWDLTCQQVSGVNPPQCAIQPTDQATAALVTASENFCSVVSTALPLSGSLASFADGAFANNKTNFLVGQTLHFRASVFSPNVTVISATINTVKLSAPSLTDVLLIADTVVTSQGTTASFATSSVNSTASAFSFVLVGGASGFIPDLADDSSRDYTVTVIIDVDYQDIVTTKRGVETLQFVTNANTQPVGVSSRIVAEPQFTVQNSNAMSTVASFFFVLVSVVNNIFNL